MTSPSYVSDSPSKANAVAGTDALGGVLQIGLDDDGWTTVDATGYVTLIACFLLWFFLHGNGINL